MAGDKNLKKRAKASPNRLQKNVRNKHCLTINKVEDNDFLHLSENIDIQIEDFKNQNISYPLSFFIENKDQIRKQHKVIAVQITADQQPEDLKYHLKDIDIIVLTFVSYVDGRSYSHAQKLRTQLAYEGQIRAVGDVHFDQLEFLHRVGCDAFEIPDEEDASAALSAFNEIDQVYQPAADSGTLIFQQRRHLYLQH